MGNVNYNQWINGNDCCCNDSRQITGDACSCDQILLEISNLHTDDGILQDEIDELSGKVETNYYTKEEVDEKIASGGSGTSITVDDHLDLNSTNPTQNKVITEALNGKLDESAYTPTDLSNYYNKSEVNDIITSAITDVEAEIPSQLSAGTNINITNNVISAIDTTYTAGSGITIDSANTITCTVSKGDLVKAGRDISITSGYYKTINLDLPLSGNTDYSNIKSNLVGNSETNQTNNSLETAFGEYNISNHENNVFASSGNTLFSVGNGSSSSRHNAFEIRATGDIYIADTNQEGTYNQKPMVKLQDYIQERFWCGTQSEYDALVSSGLTSNNVLYLIHE